MNKKYGNAQTIGCGLNQNTYFMVKQGEKGLLAVLADGGIDSVTGACAAILSCESVAKGFIFEGDISRSLEQQFSCAAAVLKERLYKGRSPRVSLLAACFLQERMIYKQVGEMSLAYYGKKGLNIIKNEAGQAECKGNAVLLCNQGVWQALTELDVEGILAGKGHPHKKAQKLIERVNRRNLKDQKSVVAIIVK